MDWLFIIISSVIAMVVSAVAGIFLVPYLTKLKFGQTIREEGPKWHMGKQGTPTMGGLMFIIGIAVSLLATFLLYGLTSDISRLFPDSLSAVRVIAGFCMALLFGAVGFIDDFVKVAKKRNLGLTASQKLILQFLIASAYLYVVYLFGGTSETYIPFVGTIDLGVFYWIIADLAIVGICNAVNLTDGIDGLNGSVTLFYALFMSLIASTLYMVEMSIFSVAVAGGCLGFLYWNFNPAKVFMGDTGSLFLGGIVAALAFGLNMPILLLPIGIVYLMEMFSVILQVGYFKLTKGKRLFKMSPIHHHFEMCGWSETKIVVVFSLITSIGGLISLLCVIFSA